MICITSLLGNFGFLDTNHKSAAVAKVKTNEDPAADARRAQRGPCGSYFQTAMIYLAKILSCKASHLSLFSRTFSG
jgi:hypothetical protein